MTNPNNFQPGQAIDTEDALNDAMYPRLENESEADYKARLEKMHAAADAWQQLGQEAPAENTEANAVDTFRERMQKRVEDGTYTQEEADAKIARAEAMHAEKANAAAAAEQAAAEQAQNDAAYAQWAHMSGQQLKEQSDAIANDFAGEQNVNTATGKERKGGLFDQYPRMAGESNEEYGARLHQISEMEKQYLAEHPDVEKAEEAPEEKDAYTKMVEERLASGDIEPEKAEALLARREAVKAEKEQKKAAEAENQQAQDRYAESAEKAKMEMAERIRQNDPEAVEFLEKHPELRTEMVAAVQKLEELEKLEKANNRVDEKLDKALEERNNMFMAANDDFLGAKEAYDNAKAANEAARAEMKDLEERAKNETISDEQFAAVEEKIHKTEEQMKDAEKSQQEAQTKKDTISSRFDRYEAAIRGEQEKFNKSIQERMAARDKFVEQQAADYNSDMSQARAGIEEAEKVKANASAKLAELQEKQKNGEAVDEKVMKDLEGQIKAAEFIIKQNGIAIQKIKQHEVEVAGKMGGTVNEMLSWNDFYKSYREDEELINKFFMKDGQFEEERFNKWVREVYEAKKSGKADDEEDEKPEVKPAVKAEADTAKNNEADAAKGLETAEQKGLFAKLKNFFNKNKRSKAGAERALRNEGGVSRFKKLAYVALMSLVIGTNLANVMQVKAPTQTPSMEPMKVYAAEANVDGDTGAGEAVVDDGIDLQQVSETLSLTPDLGVEQGEQDPDIINTQYSDGTNLEINMSYGDYEESAFFSDNKEGVHNLTPWLYDFENEDLTDAERAEQIQENLNQLADDPTIQGQIAGFMGDDIQIDGKSVESFADMRDVQTIAQQDEEFRLLMADTVRDIYADFIDDNTLNLYEVESGTVYGSLYAMNMAEDGEMPRLMYFRDDEVTARVDFEVMQYLDENGQNILDTNEIGGYKYNFLKAAGVIPENATDEEAQEIMAKYKILGISGKCGQVIWRLNIPDSGDETSGKESAGSESVGNESAGNESDGDESAGTESAGNESAGNESDGDESAGTESVGNESAGDESAGNESVGDESVGNESVGNESVGDESAGNESVGDESVGNESVGDENISVGNESVGNESVGDESVGDEGSYDGKTDVYVDEDNDGWTVIDQPTQDETGPTSEAGDDNGYVNDNNPGGSSDVAEDDSLNGGDQGGGDTDSDGGGSTNPDTEATYDGTDTSGWQGDQQSEEPGTQDVQEPSTQEEVNQVNDSEANQDAAGDTETDSDADADEAMNRIG